MRSAVGSAYLLEEGARSHRTLTAAVEFDAASPIFAGHYPELPVVPGVLLIDLGCRIAAALSGRGRWQIHSAQFSAPVHPATPISLEAQICADEEVRVRVVREGRKVASIRLRPDERRVAEVSDVPSGAAEVPSGGVPVEPRLPHRPPMSFLDDAVAMATDRLQARCGRASIEFHRHTPIFTSPDPAASWPAALILESWCQAAAVLMMQLEPELAAPAVLISRLAAVRTHAEVEIGETIDLSVRLLERYPHASTFTGCARVGRRVVLDIDRLTATLRPFDQLRSPS